MSLSEIRMASSVQEAISEFEALGRDQFLKKYGFGPARRYYLEVEGRRYDSKAIVGAAHGYEFPKVGPLRSAQFNGGETGAKRKLEQLGFTVLDAPRSDGNEQGVAPSFVVGALHRRRDLHAHYGGQQQGGISTPSRFDVIFVFSGESGQEYGYHDEIRPDGTYWYSGEGQRGDMPWVRGNAAIRDHVRTGKTIHVFRDAGDGWVSYEGEASYLGHHEETAPDVDGNPRKAIVFELSLEARETGKPYAGRKRISPRDARRLWTMEMMQLRCLALERGAEVKKAKDRKTLVRERSDAVRIYVLRRARGVCEACGQPAPFKRPDGYPYLEPHHIRRVADGGPDHPRWVAGICPNCHRRVHCGEDGQEFNQRIAEAIEKIEPS